MENVKGRLKEREILRRQMVHRGERFKELKRRGAPADMLKRCRKELDADIAAMKLLNLELADYDESERMKENA